MFLIEEHTEGVVALAYSSDGRILASGRLDGTVSLWDPLDGRELRRLLTERGVAGYLSSLVFSPDDRIVAAGLQGGTAELWNVGTGARLRRHALGAGGWSLEPTAIAFSADGHRFATGYRSEVIEWEKTTDRRLAVKSPGTGWPIRQLAYSRAGRLAVGDRNIVSVWPPNVRTRGAINWPEGDILGLCFSPTSEMLAVARGRDVGLFTLDEDERRFRCRRTLRHGETVRAIAFTQDGRTVLTAGDDWTVHLHDAATGERRNSFNWRLGPILALAAAPDGMTAAVTGRDRTGILIFDLE